VRWNKLVYSDAAMPNSLVAAKYL